MSQSRGLFGCIPAPDFCEQTSLFYRVQTDLYLIRRCQGCLSATRSSSLPSQVRGNWVLTRTPATSTWIEQQQPWTCPSFQLEAALPHNDILQPRCAGVAAQGPKLKTRDGNVVADLSSVGPYRPRFLLGLSVLLGFGLRSGSDRQQWSCQDKRVGVHARRGCAHDRIDVDARGAGHRSARGDATTHAHLSTD